MLLSQNNNCDNNMVYEIDIKLSTGLHGIITACRHDVCTCANTAASRDGGICASYPYVLTQVLVVVAAAC